MNALTNAVILLAGCVLISGGLIPAASYIPGKGPNGGALAIVAGIVLSVFGLGRLLVQERAKRRKSES